MTVPQITSGDFSTVLYNSNRIGPSDDSRNADDEIFDTIQTLGLLEIQEVGNKFTQRGGKKISTHSKIERMFTNFEFQSIFSNTISYILPHSTSDHCPAFIQLRNDGSNKKNILLKFNNMWPNISSYKDMLENAWLVNNVANQHFKLLQKLKQVKLSLK